MGGPRDGGPADSRRLAGLTTVPIYAAAASTFAALAIRNFILPLRIHELGGDRIEVGLLFSAVTVTAAGLSLPAGHLVDRFGKRPLLLSSLAAGGLSQLGLAVAPSTPPMYLWQGAAGAAMAAAQAVLMAALVDIVPRARMGRAIGWLTMSFQVGFLTGPAAAGAALQWLDLRTTLAASALLFGVAMVVALAVPPGRAAAAASLQVREPLREMVRQRGFAVGMVGMMGATLLWGTQQAFLPLFGKEQLGLPEAQIGYMIAMQAVANGLARIPGGRLVDRLQRRGPVVVVGLGLFAVSTAVLPHLDGFWAPTALLVVSVPILAVVYLALGVIFTNLATRETQGLAMGVYGTALYVGLGAGPAIFGPVMEHSGYVAGFTACAAAGVLLAALVAVLRSDRLRGRPAPARPAGDGRGQPAPGVGESRRQRQSRIA